MVMSRDQNAGRSCNIKIDNSSFETAKRFKYLGTTLTNKNSTQEDIKSTVKSGNSCHLSVQNLWRKREEVTGEWRQSVA